MKPATTRLFVALFSLLAALLELGAALVRLCAALVLGAAGAVRTRQRAAQPPARPRLRVVPNRRLGPNEDRARVTAALTNLGWPAPAVRRFVGGLGDRVGREPIEALIREGIAKLAA